MGSDLTHPAEVGRMETVMAATLIRADGSQVLGATALEGKDLVLFYFSAHWCGPCRRFTPMLAEFYKSDAARGVEVIFVSNDKSEEEMFAYMKEMHGDWPATAWKCELTKELNTKDGGLLTDVGEKELRDEDRNLTPEEIMKTWKS